jgi:regulator of RNase E activity RraA
LAAHSHKAATDKEAGQARVRAVAVQAVQVVAEDLQVAADAAALVASPAAVVDSAVEVAAAILAVDGAAAPAVAEGSSRGQLREQRSLTPTAFAAESTAAQQFRF